MLNEIKNFIKYLALKVFIINEVSNVMKFARLSFFCMKIIFSFVIFFKLGFTPCKAEQPLQHMKLQKKRNTKRLRDTGNLIRKSLH